MYRLCDISLIYVHFSTIEPFMQAELDTFVDICMKKFMTSYYLDKCTSL
jgi:hypothetical protein